MQGKISLDVTLSDGKYLIAFTGEHPNLPANRVLPLDNIAVDKEELYKKIHQGIRLQLLHMELLDISYENFKKYLDRYNSID